MKSVRTFLVVFKCTGVAVWGADHNIIMERTFKARVVCRARVRDWDFCNLGLELVRVRVGNEVV